MECINPTLKGGVEPLECNQRSMKTCTVSAQSNHNVGQQNAGFNNVSLLQA